MSDIRRVALRSVVAIVLGAIASLGCPPDNGDENAGAACDVADDCYPDVSDDDRAMITSIICLDVPGGYCTHECAVDTDCCKVDGECKTGFPQVCAPFESTGMRMCFLSCEADVINEDETAWCQDYANSSFGCRSTGGGSENRKVCLP